MAFTYNPTAGSARDIIRLRIGDVSDTAPVDERLEDEDIDLLLARHGSWQASLPHAARALAAKLAALPASKTVGNYTIVQKRVEHLLALAADGLSGANSGTFVPPFCGGTSLSAAEGWRADNDRPQSAFTRPQ